MIVFQTSYDSYAYSAYELEAFDYILKPVSMDKFTKNFNKVLKNIAENKFIKKYMIPKLKIKFKGEVSYISQKDIIYIEKTGKKVTIHTKDTLYEYTSSLKSLEDLLDKDFFLRCHSGFIINTDHITAYKKSIVYLDNKLSVPVSKANSAKVVDVLEKKLWEDEI